MKRYSAIFATALLCVGGCDDGGTNNPIDLGTNADMGSDVDMGMAPVDQGTDSGPTEDTAYFVPDIPHTYGGAGTPAFEVIAHTLFEDNLGDPQLLVAFRNTSVYPICAVALSFTAYDSVGAVIDTDTIASMYYPAHRGVNGTGGIVECVSPNQVAMGVSQYFDFGIYTIDDVASLRWNGSGLSLIDAVPTNDLPIQNIAVIEDQFQRNRFTGTMRNDTGGTISFPEVTVFGVNAVGRPFVFGRDIENTSVSSGALWSFETLSFDGVPTRFVSFGTANEL